MLCFDWLFFRQLAGKTVCRIFVEELVRSVLNKCRHLSSVGVGIHSAGRTMMDWSSFRLLSASRISFVMLGSGSSACWRIPLTALLTVSACSASSCLAAISTLAMISVSGIFAGVTAKLSSFFSRVISASLRDLEDKLITQLVLSTYCISTGDTAACFSRISFSNFCLCLSLVVLKTRWVLVSICSSILLASFVERVDVMLCAVDSISFFASPLAFCVSLIRSPGGLRAVRPYIRIIS